MHCVAEVLVVEVVVAFRSADLNHGKRTTVKHGDRELPAVNVLLDKHLVAADARSVLKRLSEGGDGRLGELGDANRERA